MPRSALDVKGGPTSVGEDAKQRMNSLASNLGVKDLKAVVILQYTEVTSNEAKGNGVHTTSSGLPSPIGSSTATSSTNSPVFSVYPAPHMVTSIQLQKYNSQYPWASEAN